MKLHADRPQDFSITAYGPGWISINGEKRTRSVLLSSRTGIAEWAEVPFEQLDATQINSLVDAPGEPTPELLILGSGEKHLFLHPRHSAGLGQRRVGLETMTTGAACRTFNILAGEGRHVVALLLLDGSPQT